MEKIPDMRSRPAIYTGCCLFILIIFCLATRPAYSLDGPGGKPFTDPSKTVEMPQEWIIQPIKYNSAAGNADIVITLDQHLYPAILSVIQDYAKEQRLKIVVNNGTCGISSGMLAGKRVDIAGFCCPPGDTDRLPGLLFHTIGILPLALLVHPDNPIDNITLKQARDIFQGQIHRWSELGWSNQPIEVIGRLHCKIRPGHWRLLLDNESLFSSELHEVGAIPDMIALVSGNPRAIGYEVTMWRAYRYKEKFNVLKIDGQDPTVLSSLLYGKYPLYRTLNVTTWEGENVKNPHARKLVNYLLEHAGNVDKRFDLIPASQLKQAGWKFKDDELIGVPAPENAHKDN